MKKLFFSLLIAVTLSACGTAYNSALKQVELGMTKQEVVSLMGDKYTVVDGTYGNETIEYKDRYNYQWVFEFVDGHLNKWYKVEPQK